MRKLLLLLILPFISQAQTIWTGPMTTFTKLNDADWTLEANQDRITDNVWITRANYQSIFNISDNADTSSGDCDGSSPLDTEWAFGTTADGINTLTFGPFLGTSFADCGPPSVVNQNAVLHLITDDIYIDIKFLFWTSGGNGGGFSYMRSTPEGSGDAGILLNGVVSAESNQIKNVAEPTDAQDAATKNYVDNAGIQGPAGPQGEQGIQGPTGATGPQGPQGEIGPAGADGQDGAVGATGPIGPQGPAGPQGIQGVAGADGTNGSDGADGTDGSSAYEIWVSAGNTGTEAEFLASLVGVQGEPGAQGPQGIQGETGATGSTGPAGPQGPQGIQGVAGNDGADGADGSNGSSAYEIWIAAGNTGTEAEFLASLVGAQGETGVQGPQGIQGETGATGPAGPQGETGVVSVTNSGGDGSIAYNSSTKVISYTGPSSNETRAHFSAGTGVTLTDGTIAIGQAVGTTDDVTFAHGNFTGNVTSSGGSISGFDASLNDQTGTTYTLVSTDNGKVITLNNSNGITLTVPSGLGSGFNCLIIQKGTGQIFISASGTTLINRQGHTKTAGQYAVVSIVNIGNNTIILGGDTGI